TRESYRVGFSRRNQKTHRRHLIQSSLKIPSSRYFAFYTFVLQLLASSPMAFGALRSCNQSVTKMSGWTDSHRDRIGCSISNSHNAQLKIFKSSRRPSSNGLCPV